MSDKAKCLGLELIRTDGGTQSRVCLTDDVVADYAERMVNGDKFPPIVVFHDGSDFWLADGFHRVMAAVRNSFKDVLADVRQGTRLDALKHALGANRSNGLRRTNADKRRCVVLALQSFANLSDRQVGEMCGVNHELVGSMRRDQLADSANSKRVGKDGKNYSAKKKKEAVSEATAVPSGIADKEDWGEEPELSGGARPTSVTEFDEKAVKFRLKVEHCFEKFLGRFAVNEQEAVKAVIKELIK